MTAFSAEPSVIAQEATVSVRVLRGLVEAVEHAGISRAQLLATTTVAPEQLEASEARLSRSEVYRVCERALDLTGDAALGLHWAERFSDSVFVPISQLISHARTLRQGFASLAQFYRLLSDRPGYELVELDQKAIVRCLSVPGQSPRSQRFTNEMMVAGFFRLLRCFDVQIRPERVNFAYAAPPYREEYARIFGNIEHFDQPFTGIVFDRALLDVPAPHKDDDVHQALQVLAERRLLRITQRTPYALRVRDILVSQHAAHRRDMKDVARELGLSVRSLRRRLAAEGKPYHDVANEALAIVAKHLLRDKQLSIQETAYEMGFSDTSTFHRAFKRWTGMTPSAYRGAPPEQA